MLTRARVLWTTFSVRRCAKVGKVIFYRVATDCSRLHSVFFKVDFRQHLGQGGGGWPPVLFVSCAACVDVYKAAIARDFDVRGKKTIRCTKKQRPIYVLVKQRKTDTLTILY